MKNLLFVAIICLFSEGCWSQIFLTGKTFDVGTNLPIDNVKVSITGTNRFCFTDINGQFLLATKFPETQKQNGVVFLNNNRLCWYFNDKINLSVINTEGKIVMSPAYMNNQGYIELPAKHIGLLFIIIASGNEKFIFTLTGNGSSYILGNYNFEPYSSDISDTLIEFSNPSYFSKQISISEFQNNQKVNLLKLKYDSLDYFNELIDSKAFDMIKYKPISSNMGEVEAVKIVYNEAEDEIYYINTSKYQAHFPFVKNILKYPGDRNSFVWTQYTNSVERYLYPAAINYFKSQDIYVLEFWAFDAIDCEHISKLFDKILATSYFENKLYFFSNTTRWDNCTDIQTISSEELFTGQTYQCLNPGETYGFLKLTDIQSTSNNYFGKHDLVVLNGLPNDLPVVSGIIANEFQTPLSHINILSHNRGTPNMTLIDALTNPKLDSLLGELVYLKVREDSFEIRKATIDEANVFWSAREPVNPVVLNFDLSRQGLVDLDSENITSVSFIGGKAANFSELLKVRTPDSLKIPTPEGAFAIPFYYYAEHLKKYGIDTLILKMLTDSLFASNIEERQNKLEELRELIVSCPIDSVLLDLVWKKISEFPEYNNFKFRSSTNAEDLEIFSGAGLYDSYGGKKDNGKNDIADAIKKVWSSLWNFRAFEERDYYKVDHLSVKMGVLVHRSFPDEAANGVTITKNLYNANSGFVINAQYKDYSIVYPEPGVLFDQIILYTFSLDGINPYTIEYLIHSNLPELNGENVLTDTELYELGTYCMAIKNYFYNNVYPDTEIKFSDFALDIEFKVDLTTTGRKILIKQVRPFK